MTPEQAQAILDIDLPQGFAWGVRRGLRIPCGRKRCRWCGAKGPSACYTPLNADGPSCARLIPTTGVVCCAAKAPASIWECDHIRRVVDGGTDEPANLRTLCHACHVAAGIRQRAGGA